MDRLTIAGRNGASITDASGGSRDVIDVRNSRVTITGMTIDGLNGVLNDAVDCEQGSQCTLLGNTIQGDRDAVGVYNLSSALIVGGVLQNTTSNGIFAFGDVVAAGVVIRNNPVGVVGRRAARVKLGVADPAEVPISSVTQGAVVNNGVGITVEEGAEFQCTGCVVQGNSGDGIQPGFLLDGTSFPPSVTGNTGYGVYVGDLSSAAFHGAGPTVTGNGQPDIICNSPTAVTRGALNAAGGPAHTNCAN